MLALIALGFLLGMRHATDPDHVVAITTIVTGKKSLRECAWIGALWGIGHTATVAIVGGGIIGFGWVIPVRAGLGMEFAVALMLVLLGILNLTGIPFAPVEVYDIENDTWTERPQPWLIGRTRPFVVGLVHGLAGSAAVALMVLATIHNTRLALVYLLLFGIGTIAGMMMITVAMAAQLAEFAGRGLRIASGALSLGFGLFLIYQIGFVGGLFTAHPVWTPR
jgi:high-affinity nickel-transport protein